MPNRRIDEFPQLTELEDNDLVLVFSGTSTYAVEVATLKEVFSESGSGAVTGIKGNAESTYRTGNVNLTPANIGAVSTSDTIAIAHGGTGATDAATARGNLGITPANIGAKAVQSAVSSPSASGTAVAFVDTISQDAQGVIAATKKTVRDATVDGSGLMTATQVSRLTYVYDGLQTASDNFAPEVSTYPIKAGALFIRYNSWSTLTDSAGWHLCRALVDITSASGTTSDNKGVTYEEIKVSDLYEEVYALALAAYPTDTASGSAISITDGADGLPVKSLVVDIEPVQSGSGDPSPTNVRAISGWTGANVAMAGKNLLKNEIINITNGGVTFTGNADGSIHVAGTINSATNYAEQPIEIPIKPGIYCFAKTNAGAFVQLTVYDTSHNIIQRLQLASGTMSRVITINSDAVSCRWFIRALGDTGTVVNFDCAVQLELGSTATAYEPYQGSTLSITFPTEAGTVYGGTLDVTNGVLTVDRAMVDLGTLRWTYNNGRFLSDSLTDKAKGITNIISSCYATSSVGSAAAMANNTMKGQSDNSRILIRDDRFTVPDDLVSAITGQVAIYTLANPVTYQLTPQEVTTILGNNTIYADTGDVTVTYRADPTLFASKGQTEDDMTANAAIASGAYFQIGNTLYKATAAIATGETIVPGTNCTVTNIAEALNLLNA